MDTFKISVLVLFFMISLSACKIGLDCTLIEEIPDYNDLVVVDSFLVLTNVVLPNHNERGNLEINQEFIITDSTAYQALIPESCTDCELPPIDFDSFSVTGKYLYAGCTEGYFSKVIRLDDTSLKHIIYRVDPSQCSFVACENPAFNLVRIPKLEATETVLFEVKRTYYDCDCG